MSMSRQTIAPHLRLNHKNRQKKSCTKGLDKMKNLFNLFLHIGNQNFDFKINKKGWLKLESVLFSTNASPSLHA